MYICSYSIAMSIKCKTSSLPFEGNNLGMQPKMFCYLQVYKMHIIVSVLTGQQQDCTKFMDKSLVAYRAQQIGTNAAGLFMTNTLKVLQEYQFNCSSTNITSLILGIDVRIVTNSRTLFPSVQVYRPTVNIVNQYDLVTGSERTIYYSTSNVSTATFKTAKFPFSTMDYSPWSSKNFIDRNGLKKFMQVEIDVKFLHTNFGGCGLSGFGDTATFKNG